MSLFLRKSGASSAAVSATDGGASTRSGTAGDGARTGSDGGTSARTAAGRTTTGTGRTGTGRTGIGPGRPWSRVITVAAALTALGFAAITVLAPPPQTTASAFEQQIKAAEQASQEASAAQQTLEVPGDATGASVTRDGYDAVSGLENLSKGSTNRDWAVLVLYMAGLPTSDSNITVMLRWMRQENGPDN